MTSYVYNRTLYRELQLPEVHSPNFVCTYPLWAVQGSGTCKIMTNLLNLNFCGVSLCSADGYVWRWQKEVSFLNFHSSISLRSENEPRRSVMLEAFYLSIQIINS